MTNRNVPKLRFTEFNTLWVKSSLNSISNIKTGFTPSTSNNSYWSGDYPWLSIADMNQGKYILNTSKTITKVATKNKSILKKGTLIMSFKLTIGKLSILEKDMYTNEAICGFNWKDNVNVSTEFMYYLLSSMNIKKYGSQAAKGITLNKDSLKSIPVQLPSIEEQFKIASFLSSVDNKIELLKDKKDKYVEFKHYLLQNLFPRNDELTPKLRFEEFTDDWCDFTLNSVSTVLDGTHDSPRYIKKGYPLITSKNLLKNGKIDFSDVNYISKEDYDKINKRSNVNKGDILFGMIGSIGTPVITTEDNFAIKNVALIKEREKLKNDFLVYYLNSNHILRQFYKYNAGGTQKFIALNIIRKLKVKVPSLNEQKKIVSFLSSVDKKIDLLNLEIEQVEEYKKGLLQKMFI